MVPCAARHTLINFCELENWGLFCVLFHNLAEMLDPIGHQQKTPVPNGDVCAAFAVFSLINMKTLYMV